MRGQPNSYSALTRQVVQEAGRPLTFQEILAAVNALRPVQTKNPQGTIRSAIGQNALIISLGNGTYGFMPTLVNGAVMRVRLRDPSFLELQEEAVTCLWPAGLVRWGEGQHPAALRLPDGAVADVDMSLLTPGRWGCAIEGALQAYLTAQGAVPDDWLILRVTDGQQNLADCRFEAAAATDPAGLAARDREIADAADAEIQRHGGSEVMLYTVTRSLLAHGRYQADMAPSPLLGILRTDGRFVEVTPYVWGLGRLMSEVQRAASVQRWAPFAELFKEPAAGPPVTGDSGADRGTPTTWTDPLVVSLQSLAQDFVYDAWETRTRSRRVRLAREAIGLWADCADAYVILAEDEAKDPEAALKLYQQAVAAGERALGRKKFAELAGEFWGFLETRPYMRARFALAAHLWDLGRRPEAVTHLWEMLRLNPSDNQGVRYVLLGWLLDLEDQPAARRLLDSYRGDSEAIWAYGEALTRFRVEGDSATARAALRVACLEKPLVPDYLMSRRKLPAQPPDLIESGGDSEAVETAFTLQAAWAATPGALAWLSKLAFRGGAPKTPRPDASGGNRFSGAPTPPHRPAG